MADEFSLQDFSLFPIWSFEYWSSSKIHTLLLYIYLYFILLMNDEIKTGNVCAAKYKQALYFLCMEEMDTTFP